MSSLLGVPMGTPSPLVPLIVPGSVPTTVKFSRLQVTDSYALTRKGPCIRAMSARVSITRVAIPSFRNGVPSSLCDPGARPFASIAGHHLAFPSSPSVRSGRESIVPESGSSRIGRIAESVLGWAREPSLALSLTTPSGSWARSGPLGCRYVIVQERSQTTSIVADPRFRGTRTQANLRGQKPRPR
jgi:hypothetical protein